MRLRNPFGAALLLCVASAWAGQLVARMETLPHINWGGLESREVRVYLPAGGIKPDTPVLLALDGHMMAEWRLEETLAGLEASAKIVPPLVVAIPAGRDRIDEYGLAGTLDYAGRGKKAAQFQRFLLESILPAVRRRYHLTADPARTGIMGASLGGLCAFDIAWAHPEVFGFAGVFSGSFWWRGENGPAAVQQASRLAHQRVRDTARVPTGLRLWFEAGTRDETDDRDGNGVIDAIQDTTELIDELERRGIPRGLRLRYVEVAGGRHHETTWAQALPGFLEWALPAK